MGADILRSNFEVGGILCLTLDDPKWRNTLSEAMLAALGEAFDAASDNEEVRVIILAASGPVFCAGHDLKEMSAGRQNADRDAHTLPKFYTNVHLLCRKLSPVQSR